MEHQIPAEREMTRFTTLAKLIHSANVDGLLSKEEEDRLFARYHGGDERAGQIIIRKHMPLSVKIARKYSRDEEHFKEAIQSGNVGLVKALPKFDPSFGTRFSTYAMSWIREAILTNDREARSMVKIAGTAPQKNLYYNLSKVDYKLSQENPDALQDERNRDLANIFNTTVEDVTRMQALLSGHSSLNANVSAEVDGNETFMDTLVCDAPTPEDYLAEKDEENYHHNLLKEAFNNSGLKEREKEILIARRLMDPPVVLAELSQKYGVSRERVRQIEVAAYKKLKHAILHMVK